MTKYIVGLSVIVIVAVVSLAFLGFYLYRIGKMVEFPIDQSDQFRAIPGDVVNSECFTINGVMSCQKNIGMALATRTPCAIRSPSATSTLIYATVWPKTGTTSLALIDIARATTAYATTTKIGTSYVLATSTQDLILASTTPDTPSSEAALTFPPNTWFVVKVANGFLGGAGGTGTYSFTGGKCQAVWRVTQ